MISAKQSLQCVSLLLTVSFLELAAAEVQSVGANGFEVRETVYVAAAADKAFAALLLPARWWSSEHTFSGSAANLVLDARAGGCWCENFSYAVGGYAKDGFDGASKGADRVLGGQIERLRKLIDS